VALEGAKMTTIMMMNEEEDEYEELESPTMMVDASRMTTRGIKK